MQAQLQLDVALFMLRLAVAAHVPMHKLKDDVAVVSADALCDALSMSDSHGKSQQQLKQTHCTTLSA